jgi:fimbrial isopeptide formation D2 family protein/LPXTG-motif cell wall-anchored protein
MWLKAAVSSVAVAALSLSVGVFTAAAEELGNIDTTKTGSITLHKHTYEGNDQTSKQRPDGSSADLANPVEGAVFTAYTLDLDLTDNDDWDTLSKLSVDSAVCDSLPPTTVDGVAVTGSHVFTATDEDGITTMSAVPLGAYLICETSSPASSIDKAAPFVISVPFPDNIADDPGATNTWLYDVHAYPKNALTQIDKTVLEQGDLGLGSKVSFPVTAKIPQIGDNATFKQFEIRDTLDSKLGSVAIDSVQLVAADGTKTAVGTTNYTPSISGNDARVVFNADGFAWLKTQAGASIEVIFSGVVTSLGTDGVVTNQAFLHAGTSVSDNEGIPTPEVKQNWGDVVIKKVDDRNSAAPLKDAKFEVYEAASPYPNAEGDCAPTPLTGSDPVSVLVGGTATTEFATGDDGVVTIPGLFVSDSENDVVNATFRCYVVKETQAPAGFVTPTGDAALHAVAVKTGVNAAGVIDLTVVNSKTTVPELPLTGSAGTILIILAGTALIGGSIFLMVRNQQKVAKESTTDSE